MIKKKEDNQAKKGMGLMSSKLRSLSIKFIFPSFVLAVMLLGLAAGLQATIMKFLDVEDLTPISTHIFRGEVLSNQSQWSDDHKTIYTATRIRVSEGFKGALAQGQIVTINQL